MPSPSAASRLLRNDLLAQLRTAGTGLSTTHLRQHAPRCALPGTSAALPPVQEQIYRVLRQLTKDGLIKASTAHGRTVSWIALPSAADDEIRALEAAFASTVPGQHSNVLDA